MTKTQHILVLSSWYPSRLNPFLGNFVQRQAELLSSIYQVTVLFTVSDPNIKEPEVQVSEKGQLKEIIIYHPKGSNFFSRRREQDKAFEAGLALIENVDLIHAHVVLPKGYLFVRAKKKFNCPLIITEHGSYFRKEKRKNWSLKDKFIVSFTRKHIDKLVAVSDFLKKDMDEYFKGTKIDVIPNPLDTDLFIPGHVQTDDKIRFLHISTLDPAIKNPKGIIDAMGLLIEKGYENMELVIVSDEPYLELQAYAVSTKTDKYVRFFGPCTPEQLPPFYRASNAFILFSVYESFSIVIAEAWSCGVPVISTPVGIAENMKEELGILVKIGDTLGLAIAMEKVINGQPFEQEIIREKATEYSKESVLNHLTALYYSLDA
jgi:glycosyltransferase involved in cell wall biosynthesis